MAIVKEERIGGQRLILGDCLDALEKIEAAHCVVTDPPYSSGARTSADVVGRGGMSRGQRWAAKPLFNDRMTVTGFTWLIRQVSMAAYKILPDGGSFLSFIDWRQYPTLYAVVESANFRVQTTVVWDKEHMALGNGFRNQHEFLLHASKGVPKVFDRGTPNVLRHTRVSASDLHPTEKPVGLIELILPVVSSRGETILDPFMGSGTTLVACQRLGRQGTGIEIDPEYFAIACKRVDEATRQADLFIAPPPKPVQEGLL